MENKVKVYFEYRSQNNDGHYGEDDPDKDYPVEVYYPATWSHKIVVEEYAFKDLKKAFDSEDGDDDFSNHILYITNHKDEIIYRHDSPTMAAQRNRLLADAEYYQQEDKALKQDWEYEQEDYLPTAEDIMEANK